ncbi:MAG TPA: hypothetical protein VK447_00620 [Myxococcaceae bacterium]|nr:hypothetical protein [Myxococcaceae bacterium]
MCQTHYKQDCQFGEVREIKRHRPRRTHVAKLGGLSLSLEAADMVSKVAASRGVALNHQLTDVLEAWAQKVNRAAKRRAKDK